MRLQFATWPEVESYLERSRGILIPIGSTEQHGPNGLIGTDALCPEIIADGVGERVGALIAPTVSIGMAQHHLGFPGSITLRPATLIAVVRDVVQSLMRHGFERLYFLNGHGGNVATVTAAFSEVYADNSLQPTGRNQRGPRCTLTNWWNCESVRAISRELFGAAEGSHATPSEISLTWHAYPDAVREVAMTPPRAPEGPILDADDYRRRFPDGRIGSNPGLASRAAGERLYRAAVDFVADDYRRFLAAD
jgi:creatinine amidohydrolase